MPRRYPTFDRLLALLLSLLVTATGSSTPDTDLTDDFDGVDDGGSTSETGPPASGAIESQRSRTTVIRIPTGQSSQADAIWVAGLNRTTGASGAPGAVAVAHDDPWTALISVLADENDDRQLDNLLGRALRQCRTDGDLKVIISASVPPKNLAQLVEPHGFTLSRAWREHNQTVAEFYVNLYTRSADERDNNEPRQ